MPKVSVIIPVYNVEKYLKQCLDSVVNQTLEDIEIICINDCSTDNSLSILEEYAAKDARIKVIDLKTNVKQGGARNRGLDIAQSDYIMFVDSDDYIEANTLEKFYNAMTNNDCDIVISYVTNFISDNTNEAENLCSDMNEYINRHKKATGLYHIDTNLNEFNISPVMRLYKKSIIDKYNIHFPENLVQEDIAFFWFYFTVINSAYYLNETFYHRRIHQNSTMYQLKYQHSHVFDRIEILKHIYDYLKKYDLYEKYKITYEDYFKLGYDIILSNCNREQYETADEKLKKLAKELKLNLFKTPLSQSVFSIKNEYIYKVITILGLRIKIKSQKLENKIWGSNQEAAEVKKNA